MTAISVVVPVFNSERYLHACLTALLDQDYPRDQYEIIMIDNNSRDRSPDVISGYPAIRLLFE